MDSQGKSCSLSLCMIVRDEEKYLQDCLESVKDVVDQIVVLDTGSKDNTVKIAEQYGAEVNFFKWCDDFSAARNESIKFATGDWILWLDADERLVSESVPELKNLLKVEKKPVIYKVHIRNIKSDDTYTLSSAHRLFTNRKGISFSGRIHEQVSPSVAKLRGEERNSNVYLCHLGYGFEGEEAEKKNIRNRKLLEQMVKDAPQSAYAHYTLAQHYGLSGKQVEALKHYKITYNLKQFDLEMTASLLNMMSEILLKLKRLEEARSKSRRSIKMRPVQAGAYYLLYKISIAEDKEKEAIHWLRKLFATTCKLRSEEKTISTDIIIDENKIMFSMGSLYQKLGEFNKALECFTNVYRNNPGNIQLVEKMVAIYLHTGELQQAEKYLNKLSNLTNDNLQYSDALGTILIKQKKYEEAIPIYERIYSRMPANKIAAKRLIGLYGKVGDVQKAEELLTNIRN